MPADPQYEKIHPKTEGIQAYGCKNKPRIPTGSLTSTGEVYIFSDTCRHNESHNDPKCAGCQDVGQGKSYSDTLEILNSGLSRELLKFIIDTVEALHPNDRFDPEDPRVIELKSKDYIARVFTSKARYIGLSDKGFELYIKLRVSSLYQELKV